MRILIGKAYGRKFHTGRRNLGNKAPCTLSYNHQILKFFLESNQLENVSDLNEICARSWGHIEAFRDIISLKISSQQPCP